MEQGKALMEQDNASGGSANRLYFAEKSGGITGAGCGVRRSYHSSATNAPAVFFRDGRGTANPRMNKSG